MLEFRYKNQKISGGGSGQDLTAGDGTNIKNNAINVDAPFRGVMSETEYEALPAEKKATGFALISEDTDIGEVYSTEETRIGTWIDGKPLYRKVYYGSKALTANTKVFIGLDSEFTKTKDLRFAHGSIKFPWSTYAVPYLEYDGTNVFHSFTLGTTHTDSNNSMWLAYYTQYAETIDFYVTAEYTKTTDSEGVSE